MKRPLSIVALVYVTGILAAQEFHLALGFLFLVSLSLAGAVLVFDRTRAFLLWPLIFLVGWFNLAWHVEIISPLDLRLLASEPAQLVTVQGALCDPPSYRLRMRDGRETWRSLAEVEVSALAQGTNWQASSGRVMVSTPGLLGTNYFSGQFVQITGILRPPQEPAAPGLFNYRTYLRWQGIYYELQTQSTNDWQLDARLASASPPVADRFQKWAQATLAERLPVVDEDLRLLWAMTLGWKTALTDEVSEPFMRSGTMHIFAISGLHIALIAGILVQVLRLTQVPRTLCGIIVIPLIWFYTAATGWQASAIRSTIMMTIVLAGWALKRPGDLLNSLSASGFIILLWEPTQLFQASFQLSFFVVLSIALLLPTFEKIRQRLLRTDPLLPAELRPRWHRWLDPPIRAVTTSLATSLAAWLGSLPLIAYYFHLVTPVSLLANLLIVPLSSLALMCNLGSLFCGPWLPSLSELFNQSAWLWMHLMVRLSEWVVKFPGAYFYVRAPTALELILYYSLLVTVLTGWIFNSRYRVWGTVALASIGILWLVDRAGERNTVHLTVLPLNGGHAVYVEPTPKSQDLLVDCGNKEAADFVVKPFLRAEGVNHLGHLLLTHGDVRHIGGAELILKEFDAGATFISSARQRSPTYRKILEKLERTPQSCKRINRLDQFEQWEVLHPSSHDQFSQADDNAIVLLGKIHGLRILLLSDLGKPGQSALIEHNPGLRADIIITGLPHQSEPIIDALLDVVQPQAVVVCTAEFPATERLNRRVSDRLARRHFPIFYTHQSGAVTLILRPESWKIETMRGAHLQGRINSDLPERFGTHYVARP